MPGCKAGKEPGERELIELTALRTLTLREPTAPGRPSHLSAASGLVVLGQTLVVVADDELHLGMFASADNDIPGNLIRLFEGNLPPALKPRKKRKPDLEALIRLPTFARYPHGALLALGSGSKKTRHRGVLLSLDPNLNVMGIPVPVDLKGLHVRLKSEFDDLNIEGAAIVGDTFVLFQRGHKRGANACVIYSLRDVLESLANADEFEDLRPREIRHYDLGRVAGVALSFTDAASLPNGELVFTAVAEDTDNNYDDGACIGAAVGVIDRQGQLRHLEPLATPHKLEGIQAWPDADGIRFLAVSDPDDATIAASLFAGRFRPGPSRLTSRTR